MVDALGERATFNNILILMEERLRKGEAPTIFPSPLVRDANVIAPVINIHSEITGYQLSRATWSIHRISPRRKESRFLSFSNRASLLLDVSLLSRGEGRNTRIYFVVNFSAVT